jgi:hypothetical protein
VLKDKGRGEISQSAQWAPSTSRSLFSLFSFFGQVDSFRPAVNPNYLVRNDTSADMEFYTNSFETVSLLRSFSQSRGHGDLTNVVVRSTTTPTFVAYGMRFGALTNHLALSSWGEPTSRCAFRSTSRWASSSLSSSHPGHLRSLVHQHEHIQFYHRLCQLCSRVRTLLLERRWQNLLVAGGRGNVDGACLDARGAACC